MNEAIQNILTRRSIRDFSEKTVAKSDMEILVKAALAAPSGRNRQAWKMTAIVNKDLVAKFATTMAKALGADNYCFYNATALIIPSNEADNELGQDDNACALQNIFLAAHSMGIGSVWINQVRDCMDNPHVRGVLTELGIPENHVVYGIAALGYSSSEPKGEVEKIGKFTIIE